MGKILELATQIEEQIAAMSKTQLDVGAQLHLQDIKVTERERNVLAREIECTRRESAEPLVRALAALKDSQKKTAEVRAELEVAKKNFYEEKEEHLKTRSAHRKAMQDFERWMTHGAKEKTAFLEKIETLEARLAEASATAAAMVQR